MKPVTPDIEWNRAVGGVRCRRPFRLRRLGHIGINVADVHRCIDFYQRLFGFVLSDELDLAPRFKDDATRLAAGNTTGFFLRHGTEHHSMGIFPKRALNALAGFPPLRESFSLNQIAWQVGSLDEVAGGIEWFQSLEVPILRLGRDLPGSNFHVYPVDGEHHVNELFYAMEQIGWYERSKPVGVYERLLVPAQRPHVSHRAELRRAAERGIDLLSGYLPATPTEERFDVGGMLLAQPFKVERMGPVRLFVQDLDAEIAFYRDVMGMKLTEEVVWNGHRCAFFRVNTEHHSLALYPFALRAELGLSEHTTCMSFALQLGDYTQLRDAIGFLRGHGVEIRYLPPELFPGINYTAFAIDPDGNAVQLFYYMEQIGWSGQPRPQEQRPTIDNARWPDCVEEPSDAFMGEVYLGPPG